MILGKVQIQNFKSIKDTGTVYLSRTDLITVLAGQNESGKTSFLRALRFFQEGKYDTFEEEDRKMGKSPRVDCTFFLDDSEYKDLLETTNTQIAEHIKKNGFTFVRGDLETDKFEMMYIYPKELKVLIEKYNESITVTSEANPEEGNEKPDEFDAFKYFDVIRPQMVFYSSFLENNLPGKAYKKDIINNQAILDFEKIYNVDFSKLMEPTISDKERRSAEERVRREAAESLNKYWKQTISGEKSKYSYAITINSQVLSPEQSSVNFYINQGDDDQLSFSQKSHGFQWFAGFNLRLRAHEAELEEGNGIILLIDEPGQGLHEVAQQDVKDVIEELVKNSRIQIIYSTHQPILLGKDKVDFSRLLLVDRSVKKGSKFKTISALISSSGSMDALAPIRSALGMVTITDPLKNKKTLIVEGITEYFIVKTILGTDYTILPSTGADQIPNIFGILYGWGVPAKALFDDDKQGAKAYNDLKKSFFNNDESDDFKAVAYKSAGMVGIEDYLSVSAITAILTDFEKTYDSTKNKVENVEQVGKYIFAKSFHDKYNGHIPNLDKETLSKFEGLKKFLT